MKKKILLGLLAASVFSFNFYSVSLAGPFDFNNNNKQTETNKEIDLNTLSANSTKLILNVGKATVAFADAAIIMLNATGNKEQAEKLKAVVDVVKKNPKDEEGIKKLISSKEMTGALEGLDKMDLGAKTKLNISEADLIFASCNFGGGVILDSKAVIDATELVKEATSMLDKVQKDPMKYGVSAAGTVNSIISSGKFICDNIPNQIKAVQTFTTKLVAYCNANKISPPSAEKLKEVAETMEKG